MKEKHIDIDKSPYKVNGKILDYGNIIYFNNKDIVKLSIGGLIYDNDLSQIYEKIKELSEKNKSILNLKKMQKFIKEVYIPIWTRASVMVCNKKEQLKEDIRILEEEIKKKNKEGNELLKDNKQKRKYINSVYDSNKNNIIIKEQIEEREHEIQINLFELDITHKQEELLKYKRKIKEEELEKLEKLYSGYMEIITRANETMVIIEYFLNKNYRRKDLYAK